MKGVATGVPIGILTALAATHRERNWNHITYRPVVKRESSHFGHTAWTEYNLTKGYAQRFEDPGRRPVF